MQLLWSICWYLRIYCTGIYTWVSGVKIICIKFTHFYQYPWQSKWWTKESWWHVCGLSLQIFLTWYFETFCNKILVKIIGCLKTIYTYYMGYYIYLFINKIYAHINIWGLPWWLSSKEYICQHRRLKFDPWIGKIP